MIAEEHLLHIHNCHNDFIYHFHRKLVNFFVTAFCIALGKSFETTNLSQKDHNNVQMCYTTEPILLVLCLPLLSSTCRKGESGECR